MRYIWIGYLRQIGSDKTHPAAEAEGKPAGQDQHGHRRRDQDKPEQFVVALVQLWREGVFGCSGLYGEDGRVRAVSSGASVILALVLPERNLNTETTVRTRATVKKNYVSKSRCASMLLSPINKNKNKNRQVKRF